MIWVWVLAIAVLLLLVGVIAGFNKLRRADVRVDEALGGIDVQLTRRAELIPNLVNTVKGYAEHESGVFENVTKARTSVQRAASDTDVNAKAAADQSLRTALVDLMAVAEAYPELRASENFQRLQGELSDTENKLAFARQYYNDATRALNEMVKTIPWMWFTGIASVGLRDFYAADDGSRAVPNVEF